MTGASHRRGLGTSILPILSLRAMGMFWKVAPPDTILLVRSKKDGSTLRTGYGGFVNPLTETVEVVEMKCITIDVNLTGVEATSHGERVPVNVSLVSQLTNFVRGTSTHREVGWAQRTGEEGIRAQAAQAIERRLRDAAVHWAPEELRDRPAALGDWLVKTANIDLGSTGWTVRSAVIREVTDDHGYFDIFDFPTTLRSMREGLRKAGVDPGPEPTEPLSREELGPEYQRLKLLWAQLNKMRAAEAAQESDGASKLIIMLKD